MRVCSLSSVKTRIVLGAPLPFGVRDADHTLLLARGQVITDETHLDTLFQRGALVDIEELAGAVRPAARGSTPPRSARLSAEWDRGNVAVREALTGPLGEMAAAIERSTDHLLGLIVQSPELALSQVVRQPEGGAGHYGIAHSIHAATACQAAARYLEWTPAEQRRAFQAALTMNIGMIDLQARLATQVSPLTAKQRETVHEHPTRSAEMLAQAGITDEDWRTAVRDHHEVPDGSGYPRALTTVGELAEMLRFADIYTARLSSRANRPAMSAQQAGRELHQMAAQSPLATALIKAFGIFPPGSLVRLASGELGLVTRNGEKAYHPMVATLTDAAGEPRRSPVVRDSARSEHAVVALLSAQAMPMRLTDERIADLIGSA